MGVVVGASAAVEEVPGPRPALMCADRGFPGDGVAAAGADVLGAGWEADSMNTSAT